jgi:hypothetical protein
MTWLRVFALLLVPSLACGEGFNRKYWTVAGIEGAAIAADAASSFAMIGPHDTCFAEIHSSIYGREPGPRMAAEFAISTTAGYLAKKHGKRWWAAPMLALAGTHADGAIHNLRKCN